MMTALARRPSAPPIFIVGCGRSGTTLLYEMITELPNTAWISTYSDRTTAAAVLTPLRGGRIDALITRVRPGGLAIRPSEGYRAWDRAVRTSSTGVLSGSDLDATARRRMERLAHLHVVLQRRELFVNKNTRNARRVGLIDAAFPDARFVHVVRDPRAVTLSLSRVAFWPGMVAWWRGPDTTADWMARGVGSLKLAAECWAAEVGAADHGLAAIPDSRKIEVRYEDLVKDPACVLGAVASSLGLDEESLLEIGRERTIHDRTARALEQLTDADQDLVAESCGDLPGVHGYAW